MEFRTPTKSCDVYSAVSNIAESRGEAPSRDEKYQESNMDVNSKIRMIIHKYKPVSAPTGLQKVHRITPSRATVGVCTGWRRYAGHDHSEFIKPAILVASTPIKQQIHRRETNNYDRAQHKILDKDTMYRAPALLTQSRLDLAKEESPQVSTSRILAAQNSKVKHQDHPSNTVLSFARVYRKPAQAH